MTKTKEPGIYTRRLSNGKTVYDVVVQVQGKQRWSRGHAKLEEAKARRHEMQVSMRRGQMGNAPARLTLGQYLRDRWWPAKEYELRSAESRRNYRVRLRHVESRLGDQRLAALTPLDIEAFKVQLRQDGVGEGMQNAAFDLLRQALKAAVKWEMIWRNPAEHVTAPQEGEHEAPELSVEDVSLLLRVADETTDHGTLFYMAVMTGLRWGELTSLTWPDIDMATGVLHVRRENTKSKAGKRPLLLGSALLECLQRHRLEQLRRYAEIGPAPQLVFTTPRGTKLLQTNFHNRVWGPLRDRLGLPEMHFHDLRHVNTTLMARTGAHPSVIQRRLGHADARMSLEVYTDLAVSDQAATVEALEEMLRGNRQRE